MVHRYVRDNAHGPTIIHVNHMVKEIYDYVIMNLGSNGYFMTGALYSNEGHDYGFTSSVGHLRSDSVGQLVYDDGIRTIFGAPVL